MSVVSLILKAVLTLAFLLAGGMKLVRSEHAVTNFREQFRLPRWTCHLTGVVECFGAMGMLVGIWFPAIAFLAGGWLAMTMIGAVATHLFRAHDPLSKTVPAVGLLLLSVAVSGQAFAR